MTSIKKNITKYNLLVFGLFLIVGFLLYGNTLNHDYTLDDALVITDNSFTKEGFSGIWKQLSNDQFVGFYGQKKELVSGGRYRPLSMVVFNIQYAIAGANPQLGHLVNVLAYIFNGFLLFLLLSRLLSRYANSLKHLSLPLLISLLWFSHPIHTEVVANIKGLDEIMAFCFEILTLWFILNYLDRQKIIHLLISSLFFFLALLSKENSITWLAIIPLSIYFFTRHTVIKAVPAYISLVVISAGWAFIRYKVVGGGISDVADNIMNDPFLGSSLSEKYATIMLTLGKYVQLLFFPHPLTYDYYPFHIPIVEWSNRWVIVSLIVYLFMAFVAIYGFLKKSIVSYGILFFIITLSIASNIVFVIGAFMNERFIYVSSLGFCMILGYYLNKGISNKSFKAVSLGAFIIILGLYSIKTYTRSQVWKDNLTLSVTDANTSVNGTKSNVMAGGSLTDEAMKQTNPAEKERILKEAIFYLNRAITVYPEYTDALLLMGNAQWQLTKDSRNTMPYYYRILSVNPGHQNTWRNSMIILGEEKNIDSKIQAYQTLLRYNPGRAELYWRLGLAYGQGKNDLLNAQKYLEAGQEIAPNNVEILSGLGTLYGIQKNYSAAVTVLERATQIKPQLAKPYIDLGVSYYNLGQTDKAQAAFNRAHELDNTISVPKLSSQ